MVDPRETPVIPAKAGIAHHGSARPSFANAWVTAGRDRLLEATPYPSLTAIASLSSPRKRGYMRDHTCFTYILTNRPNGTLYTGVTNDLVRRLAEHREGRADSFTKRYGIHRLVWFELHTDIQEAILREKRIKKWNRSWKVDLIEAANPTWRDLEADFH
jgi:putative endonuclease